MLKSFPGIFSILQDDLIDCLVKQTPLNQTDNLFLVSKLKFLYVAGVGDLNLTEAIDFEIYSGPSLLQTPLRQSKMS